MIYRLITILKSEGFSILLIKILAKILREEICCQVAKNKAQKIIEKNHKSVIAYGPSAAT